MLTECRIHSLPVTTAIFSHPVTCSMPTLASCHAAPAENPVTSSPREVEEPELVPALERRLDRWDEHVPGGVAGQFSAGPDPKAESGTSEIFSSMTLAFGSAACRRAARLVLAGLDVGHQGVVGEPRWPSHAQCWSSWRPSGRLAARRSRGWPWRRRFVAGAVSCRWPRAPAGCSPGTSPPRTPRRTAR